MVREPVASSFVLARKPGQDAAQTAPEEAPRSHTAFPQTRDHFVQASCMLLLTSQPLRALSATRACLRQASPTRCLAAGAMAGGGFTLTSQVSEGPFAGWIAGGVGPSASGDCIWGKGLDLQRFTALLQRCGRGAAVLS